MKKKTIWITSAAVGTVLVLGGAGIAVAVSDPFDGAPFDGDDRLTGTSLDRAGAAALNEIGSGTVTDAETSDDAGRAYEVEVTLPNGKELDVHLDESFTVVRVDGDNGTPAVPDAAEGTDSSDPADLPALTDADRAAASSAALAALPAGTVGTITEVERSDDVDHAYEVEVTLEDGQDIDVELDEAFAVVTVDGVPAA